MQKSASFLKDTWSLIAPYWKSQEKWLAILLLTVIILLNLGQVYINVLINKWYNVFYDTLQNHKMHEFMVQIVHFCYLAVIFIVITVYSTYLNQMLQIRWRRWLTDNYLSKWLEQQNYYLMELTGHNTDNPDQRISEDINQFINLTLGLSLGLISAVVTLFSFLTILWHLSGALQFHVGKFNVYIPGYMVWVALIYSFLGTWITMRLGSPLIRLNFDQQRYEANFRFNLMRLRENSESIAFYKGEPHEKQNFLHRFKAVFDNYWQIMRRQKKLTWFTSGYGQVANIFPYVVIAPRFFTGRMELGGLMQTGAAFGQVQGSLSYIINSYGDIATWKATTNRLLTFNQRIQESKHHSRLKHTPIPSSSISARDLTIRLPDGSALLENLDLCINPQQKLLISGPSGCGKTTILRTLAGIWPYAEGSLYLPADARLLFLPQKPYLPLGTLKQILSYLQHDLSNERLLEILESCHLSHLQDKIDQYDNWSQILSIGEQQRIALARAILHTPDFLFLDEATSALDESTEHDLYRLLSTVCAKTALISVAHRSTVKVWHTTEWNFA